MKRYHILVADNDEETVKVCAEFLERRGYAVVTASNPTEAQMQLENERLHLAVLDLRLNDESESDRSGLRLAKNYARALPKIIWTKFPVHEDVREALKPDLFDLPPAVDFVDQRKGYKELMAAVEGALEKHARINWSMSISWEDNQSMEQLVQKIVKKSEFAFWSRRIAEVEDLLRKLFYECDDVMVGQALLEDALRVIVPIYAYRQNRQEQYVVSLGKKEFVQEEVRRYETAVPQAIRTNKINLVAKAETNHFMAAAFTVFVGNLEKAQLLETYFERNSAESLQAVINNLFQSNLLSWYQRARQQELSEKTFYFFRERILERIDFAQLNEVIQGICDQADGLGLFSITSFEHQLAVRDEARNEWHFQHPLALFDNNPLDERTAVDWGQIHGCLCRNTILVDDQANTWLINFLHAGRGPLLNDFAFLETSIKYYLLQNDNLSERVEMEQALVVGGNFDQFQMPSRNEHFTKVSQMIRIVREQARFEAGCEWQSYQLGLYFAALAFLSQFDLSRKFYLKRALLPFAHALCTAAMCASQLAANEVPNLPQEAFSGLWLDQKNKTLWREGEQIELTVQEYAIVDYLYQYAGKLRERQTIVEQALKETYNPDDRRQTRLNTAMSRLIKKIERDPDSRRYLHTIHGRGYQLNR